MDWTEFIQAFFTGVAFPPLAYLGTYALKGLIKRWSTKGEIRVVDWKEFGQCLKKLQGQLEKAGWIPDVVIGVSAGGTAIADMLTVLCWGQRHETRPLLCTANVKKDHWDPTTQPAPTDPKKLQSWTAGKNVLVVEDYFKDGVSLAELWHNLGESEPGKQRALLVLAVPNTMPVLKSVHVNKKIDYSAITFHEADVKMPWGSMGRYARDTE